MEHTCVTCVLYRISEKLNTGAKSFRLITALTSSIKAWRHGVHFWLINRFRLISFIINFPMIAVVVSYFILQFQIENKNIDSTHWLEMKLDKMNQSNMKRRWNKCTNNFTRLINRTRINVCNRAISRLMLNR